MKPSTRSLIRSLIFNLAPVLLALAADALFLQGLGIKTEYALLVASVAGVILRTAFPNVVGSRPTPPA